MSSRAQLRPTLLVIFGAGGDLTERKLMPAVYNLFCDRWMPENFSILGVGRHESNDDAFRNHVRAALDRFSRSGKTADDSWRTFAPRVSYLKAELADPRCYARIQEWREARQTDWGATADCIYYLAIPPTLIEAVSRQLSAAGLAADRERTRIVIEKPFGRDLESARGLDAMLAKTLDESQIYRIDHYLGKETVQNILAFRFANSLFEPVWNRRYIDHMQITVAEEVGVEGRAGYYEQAGALRDMVQNHLLQILCHVAMEPPVTYAADEVRNKKADVLRAIRVIEPHEVAEHAVRGQYGPGTSNGEPVKGYREEPRVAPASATETYAALRLFVDNWRWQDVPFYLRTGKRMPARVSEACIQFRPVPHRSFPISADSSMLPNCLTMQILPDEGIVLRFQAKRPGHRRLLQPVNMKFSYQESFHTPSRDAYETLLRDVMLADPTLFMRADQVEAAWSVVEPILREWERNPPVDFPNYAAGSCGPAAADQLLERDGRHWICKMATEPVDDGESGS